MGANGDRPEWLSFKDAVAWAGVSRQRLNQAIWRGEIEAERGGPGVKARVNYQSLNRWLYTRGLLTRTPEPSTTTTLERLERLVESIDDRLEGLQGQLDGLQRQYDALFHCYEALSNQVTLVFKHMAEERQRRVEELQQAKDRAGRIASETTANILQTINSVSHLEGPIPTSVSPAAK